MHWPPAIAVPDPTTNRGGLDVTPKPIEQARPTHALTTEVTAVTSNTTAHTTFATTLEIAAKAGNKTHSKQEQSHQHGIVAARSHHDLTRRK